MFSLSLSSLSFYFSLFLIIIHTIFFCSAITLNKESWASKTWISTSLFDGNTNLSSKIVKKKKPERKNKEKEKKEKKRKRNKIKQKERKINKENKIK